MHEPDPLLEVRDLRIDVDGVPVVRGVGLHLDRGETLALVGESGCGKSLTALALPGLLPPVARCAAGALRLRGRDLTGLGEPGLRRIRGNELSMIFQEPSTSLNPLMTVEGQLVETFRAHQRLDPAAARAAAREMLERVGIPDPPARLRQYPFELSGGMCQRVMIAIALACRPALLIADEPTTALDVTIQAQILDLVKRMRSELGTAVLLITHDLGVVADMADRVAVMYAGAIVEEGKVFDIFERPRHPYTRLLLRSVPRLDDVGGGPLPVVGGVVPEPRDWPAGCRFHPRCPLRAPHCEEREPGLEALAGLGGRRAGHRVACWCHERAPAEIP